MNLNLHVNTLFQVTMHVEVLLGLLLYFAWSQNFAKRALAWWGSAHLMRAVSLLLFGMHGSVPPSISIDVANAVLFASFALTWSGARVFDGRRPELPLALVGVAIWIVACRLPVFAVSAELRAVVAAGIVTSYAWLAAFELWRGRAEALVSRWPAIFILFTYGSLFLLRTPRDMIMTANQSTLLSGWPWLVSMEELMFTISLAFILLAIAKERTEYNHRTAARTDQLTGIANRRGFLEQAHMAPPPGTQSSAVLLFDLDHFKLINDRYGHAVGDRALQVFAKIAKDHIGSAGIVGRWGGDEFVAVLHGADPGLAAATAERIQAAFAASSNDIDGRPIKATVSTGLVTSDGGAFNLSALLARADQALYCAKASGRNRLEIAPPQTEPAAPSSAGADPVSRRSAA